MTKFLSILSFFLFTTLASAQLLITEISYNSPDPGQDSLEYIAIYNSGDAVDVTGYSMVGVGFDFPSMTIAPNEFIYLAIDAEAFLNTFGLVPMEFTGALSNGGEDVSILDQDANIVHEVDFDDGAPWPTSVDGTDGGGASIVLCDFDNPSLGESWKASQSSTGKFFNGIEIFGNPGSIEDPACGSISGIIVTTMGLEFVPKDITINEGEKITFVNGGGNHNANGGLDVYPNNPEGFTSGTPSSDAWTYEFTFNIPGLYDYQCDLHVGAGMVGTVTVIPAADNSDLRVTEVLYNTGITPDTLEFIELYNAGTSAANLMDYTLMTSAINSTLGSMEIGPGEYAVIAKSLSAFNTAFPGTTDKVIEWGEGTLSNQGDNIILMNASGLEVLSVSYDDDSLWPVEADGFGASLILCNPTGAFDLSNIKANTYPEVSFNGMELTVSPGAENYCAFPVSDVTQVDVDGNNTMSGTNAILEGIVYGINLRPGGLQFTLIDDIGNGISTFSGSDDLGYTVNEGDRLMVLGNIGQFSGLSQIYLDQVTLLGNEMIEIPAIITELNEETESQFVMIENVTMVDPMQWVSTGGSFNFTVTDGTNNYDIRIDDDVEGIAGSTHPTGTFSVTGIGGQFDEFAPFDGNYQLLPRYKTDIDPFIAFVNDYPPRTIGEVTNNDVEGVADSLAISCALEGLVYGINFRASGLQFTLIDDAGDGIAVFSANENFDYTVVEGDRLLIKGVISQFTGLTQINPDSLFVMGNESIELPTSVTVLDETTESQLVTITNELNLTDPNDWKADGTSFTVIGTDGTNNYTIIIDNDSDLSTELYQNALFKITGIGSQRDVSEPLDSDYRIYPRYISDVDYIVSTDKTYLNNKITLSPNPVMDQLSISYDKDVMAVLVYDNQGKMVISSQNTNQLDVSNIPAGTYIVRLLVTEGIVTKKFVKLGN